MSLTGKKPGESYKDLLQLDNLNSGLDGTLRNIKDGDGVSTPLQVSATAVNITSGLQIGGTPITVTGSEINSVVSKPLTLGTSVSASGTSVNFTGIPSWVKRITVMFVGISTSGDSPPTIQLGDSGGVETTGYFGNNAIVGNSVSLAVVLSNAEGFRIGGNTVNWAGPVVVHGSYTVSLMNDTSNTWVINGFVGRTDASTMYFTTGSKSLSDTLDRIRITTLGGAQTFDAGSFNILYEG